MLPRFSFARLLPRLGFSRLLWFVLLTGALLVFVSDRSEADEGLASWYGPGMEGRKTASGEPYDPDAYTAAHKTLPLGTELVVTYRDRSVPVRVNDRGPYVANRELDLSQAAAREIGLMPSGVGYVEYDIVDLPEFAPSRGPDQQPRLTQGTAELPSLTQEVAQEPEATQAGLDPTRQGLVQQPALPQQGAPLPDLSQAVIQPSDSSQGITQSPDVSPEAPQLPDLPERAGQPPGLPQPTTQQPDLLQGAAQDPWLTQGATLQPGLSQAATQEEPNLSGDVLQQPVPATTAVQKADLSRSLQGAVPQLALAQPVAQQPSFSQGVPQQTTGATYPASDPNYLGGYPAVQNEANGGTYIVQPGDTLSQIAARLGVSVDYLARYNHINDPDVIYDGQPLYFQTLERGLVGIGEDRVTDELTIPNSSETIGANTAIDEEDIVQPAEGVITTVSPLENWKPWALNETILPSDTAIGGERYLLPATGGGG